MKLFVTILSVLLFLPSFSQLTVGDIKNDSDVVRFVRNYFLQTQKKSYRVSFCKKNGSFLQYDKIHGKLYDSIRQNTKWFTVDINRDGKFDLVFCGCIQDEESTVLFLSDSKNKYKRIFISPDNCSYSPNFIYKYAKDSLVFSGIKHFEDSAGGKYVIQNDTIIYSNAGLTEINSSRTYKKIDSLILTLSIPPLYNIRSRYLTIYKNGVLKFEKQVKEGDVWWLKTYVYNGSISKPKSILNLVEHLPYYKYLKMYDCDVADGGVWFTDVYFADKKTLEISDHMGIAPFGLRNLYNYAYELFKDKNWKFVSSKRETRQ